MDCGHQNILLGSPDGGSLIIGIALIHCMKAEVEAFSGACRNGLNWKDWDREEIDVLEAQKLKRVGNSLLHLQRVCRLISYNSKQGLPFYTAKAGLDSLCNPG